MSHLGTAQSSTIRLAPNWSIWSRYQKHCFVPSRSVHQCLNKIRQAPRPHAVITTFSIVRSSDCRRYCSHNALPMAYQSRIYQSQFTYEPLDNSATDFNARIGRVLNRGAYSGPLHKSDVFASTASLEEPALLSSQTQKTSTQAVQADSLTASSRSQNASTIAAEYTWVDATGKQLPGTSVQQTQGTMPASQQGTPAQTKPYNKEVVDLWKRTNPGVMEKYVDMPESTMTDHFRWLPEQQEPLDMTQHLKKTDFTNYNEVAARVMKSLITNKNKA